MVQIVWSVLVLVGGGIAAYATYPYLPALFSLAALKWMGSIFALLWGGILLVLPRLGDLPADQVLSPEEMRRIRPVVRFSVRRMWIIAMLNLACAILLFVIAEFRSQALTREFAFAVGMLLGIGIFYFLHVPFWLAEIREFRWKLAERESARKRKQDALRELGGQYEADPRFDKPLI